MQRVYVLQALHEYRQTCDVTRREELAATLILAIHPVIRSAHFDSSELAVRAVLRAMFFPPVSFDACVRAVSQLCRDYEWQFTEDNDRYLIADVISHRYFSLPTRMMFPPDTQDGVV